MRIRMVSKGVSLVAGFAVALALTAGEETVGPADGAAPQRQSPLGANLIPNPGFEKGEGKNAESWSANGFGGAECDVGRTGETAGVGGTYCFSLKHRNDQGGVQLMSPLIPLPPRNGGGPFLNLALRYKGAAHVQVIFHRRENGKYVGVKNPLGA